jgi:hypothetical protein
MYLKFYTQNLTRYIHDEDVGGCSVKKLPRAISLRGGSGGNPRSRRCALLHHTPSPSPTRAARKIPLAADEYRQDLFPWRAQVLANIQLMFH